MPIPWLLMLQNLPWTDVIRNAPKVADAGKKLWSTVSGQSDQSTMSAKSQVLGESPVLGTSSGLETRVFLLEETVSNIHKHMLASSELIKILAKQNSEMIARMEANRRWMIWLSLAIGATSVIAIISSIISSHNGP